MRVADYTKLIEGGSPVTEVVQAIHSDGVRLAGRRDDMAQRAVVYHHLYMLSAGNFVFPLIAAHGALWAKWYLVAAQIGAGTLSLLDVTSALPRRERVRQYKAYVNAFKDINRSVMVESYTVFHASRLFGPEVLAEYDMPPDLIEQMMTCHAATQAGTRLSDTALRQFYEDYFRWEQVKVVGPVVDAALAAFDWRLMRWFCLRPWVWFSYFRFGRSMNFKNFADAEERTQKGLIAFDRAAPVGWDRIEANLRLNPFFPKEVSLDPNVYFGELHKTEA